MEVQVNNDSMCPTWASEQWFILFVFSAMRPDMPCITEINQTTDGKKEPHGSSLAPGAHHNILEGVLLLLIPG
jgi:hypothetical protein